MLVRVAHSPDSDDAFMFWALAKGRVDTEGLVYEHVLRDIETLNRAAETSTYEVTALSIHAYAYLADRYLLLPHGASMGDGYGPVLVARKGFREADLAAAAIAIPGARTSAALALGLWRKGLRTKVMDFAAIQPAVAAGEVAAGVIIHEGQLTYAEEGLSKIVDLGEWWKGETGLPLPLGGNGIRRDLPPDLRAKVSRHLHASIATGLAHREEGLAHAESFSRGLPREKTDRFVGMYVNDWTLDYGERGRRAIALFLERGYEAGLLPRRVVPEFAA
ncbi:MAG: ABC transporter substrate-binding protein [Planctomycetaceae bacterium]|nr:ABC transporter substrate-binding protein [Planctomycetota bacterium]NUN53640.1 ABC transporter substrate-binding protein [Planctomycetaceae bacterium]